MSLPIDPDVEQLQADVETLARELKKQGEQLVDLRGRVRTLEDNQESLRDELAVARRNGIRKAV